MPTISVMTSSMALDLGSSGSPARLSGSREAGGALDGGGVLADGVGVFAFAERLAFELGSDFGQELASLSWPP